jgi:hypothetical protein
MKNFSKKFLKLNSSNIFKNTFINFSKNNYTSKSNYSDVNNLTNNEFKISFYSKIQISKESYVFRFLLPDSETIIGNKVCEYIYLEATMPNNKIFKRPYHPISLDTDKGFIDLMVKIYPKELADPEYGIFSNYLNTLEVIYLLNFRRDK